MNEAKQINLHPEGVIVMTSESLKRFEERIINNVRDEMRTVAKEVKDDDKRPIRTKEAMVYLSLSRTQFAQWIRSGKIPDNFIHRKAGAPYFFKHELRQCV